jgi:hypothetical protein
MEYSTLILAVVLGFFGILFILLIVYVVNVNKAKMDAKGASVKMPPLEYMKSIGSKCPDYWVDMGPDPTRSGYHICHNQLNIPVHNPDNTVCYSDKNKRFKSFKDCNVTDKGFDDADAERERCRFVAQCGPSENMTASWLGVSSDQTSPGYTNCGSIYSK